MMKLVREMRPSREPQPSRLADSFSGYHYPRGGGCIEVFWWDIRGEQGWYWWPCWPGCLPDSDPAGPFKSSAEAYLNSGAGGE